MSDLDTALIQQFAKKLFQKTFAEGPGGRRFRNSSIAQNLGDITKRDDFERIHEFVCANDVLTLQSESHLWTDTDKEERDVFVLRASLTDLWPMGTHYWIRDNALVAGRLLQTKFDVSDYHKQGRALLLSALTLISSAPQLDRFQALLEGDEELRQDAGAWPYIFFSIKENLNTAVEEPWMHIQDAWQMLAYHALLSLKHERIRCDDLTTKHVEFLSLVLPLFEALPHTEQENAGSWEELVSLRNSVLIWEYKVLELIAELSTNSQYDFLVQKSSRDSCLTLLKHCREKIDSKFPHESAEYPSSDPRYREADSALIALLYLDYVKTPEKEDQLLSVIESLRDPRIGGYRRYLNDSYQRSGFFRPSTVKKLREYYGAPSGEASGSDDFIARDRLVPKGPEAVWLHFVFQLSSWAGKRYLETGEERYFKYQTEKLLDGLALVTGDNEYTLSEDADGAIEIQQLPPFRIPECYLTDYDSDKNELIFPTPHTPLNWAIGEAIAAFDMMKQSLLS